MNQYGHTSKVGMAGIPNMVGQAKPARLAQITWVEVPGP